MSGVVIDFDVVIGNMARYVEGPVGVDHNPSGNVDEDIKPDGDGNDNTKSNQSANVAEVSKVYACDRGALLSFVDGRIDDIASSDKSNNGVSSSSKEKDIKEDAVCK